MRRFAVAVAAVAAVVLTAPSALAEPRTTTRDGKTLTVASATDLPAAGTSVRVTGRGYDRSKGIYVAFCVDNGSGRVPTPCGGGADTEGSSGNSVWISDLPPAYGTGLAKPYGDGGSFDVQIRVGAVLRADDPETEADETVDCRKTRCAVVTRNDHTRSEDRSQDVAVPVTFAAPAAAARPQTSTRTAAAAPTPQQGVGGAGATPAAPTAAASAAASAAATSPASSAPVTEPPAAGAPLAAGAAAAAPSSAATETGGLPAAVPASAAAALLAGAGLLVRRRWCARGA